MSELARKDNLYVKVTVKNQDGEILSEWVTNYLTTVGKQKIAKCAYWALINGNSMLTEPAVAPVIDEHD
jgi:hypothetical protein